MSRAIEETFNQALGKALRKTTVRWKSRADTITVERTGVIAGRPHLRPDLLIHDFWSPPLVIECSFQERDAERDAKGRLGLVAQDGGWAIKTALAVHVPEVFRSMSQDAMEQVLGAGEIIRYAVYQLPAEASLVSRARRWPRRGFISGTVYDLAALVPAAALRKEDIAQVAEEVASLLESAANHLVRDLPAHIQEHFVHQVYQRSPLTGLRTIMVLWLDAALTQSFLHKHGVAGTSMSRRSVTGGFVPSEQVRIWEKILARNWRPIFAPAVASLREASESHSLAAARALDQIDKARERIEIANLGLHINVGAELFPILSDDRKEAAAYYTQPSTAELLAYLTIQYEQLDASEWADARLFARRRLADLTCGTGTLLRAGYRRAAAFHERAGGTEQSCNELHRVAMECGLVGADISPIAAHLTSSSLAGLGRGEPYGESQIGWIDVGGTEGWTGSLEYFDVDNIQDLFGAVGGVSSGSHEEGASIIGVPDHSFDWMLMNPPYSRTRGGQSVFDIAGLTREERKACQKRWRNLVRSEPCSNQAGMAASFLALARRKVKRGGRIGFVLPLTAALADSWVKTRQMIERDFDDVMAIAVAAGQALGKDAFSADTYMEEMLLVGTRKRGQSTRGGTIHCVTLQRPPTRMGEAGEIARAVCSASSTATHGTSYPIRVGQDEIGQLCVLQTEGTGAPWSPVGALRPDLVRAGMDLSRGELAFAAYAQPLGVPMATIGEVFEVGPTHDMIGHLATATSPRGAFAMHPVRGNMDAIGQDRSLWAADSGRQRALEVLPTHKGSFPKGVGSAKQRKAMRTYRSTLLYARNMRWTSQKLLSATTAHAVLGGRAWVSLGHEDTRVRKAFALWANSTLGMLVHWTRGQRTQLGRSTTQIGAVKKMPCPQLGQLSEEGLHYTAAAFDRVKSRVLLPACQAHADGIRRQIDTIVLKMLGLHDEATQTIDTLRMLWCHEPSVHGNNKRALQLLSPVGID